MCVTYAYVVYLVICERKLFTTRVSTYFLYCTSMCAQVLKYSKQLISHLLHGILGSSAFAGVIALTLLWMQQYDSGQVKMAVIVGKVCTVCDAF